MDRFNPFSCHTLQVEDGLVQSEQLLELEQGEFEGAVRRECFPPELIASFAADPWVSEWGVQGASWRH